MKRVLLGITFLLMAFTGGSVAQTNSKNELGLTLGVEVLPDRDTASGTSLRLSSGVAFGANFARRISGDETALYLEFPLVAAPSHDVLPVQVGSIGSLATLYVTPSLRVQFSRRSLVSPWFSAGFGYGWFEGSKNFPSGALNTNRNVNTATVQFGVGADVRTPVRMLFPISLRAELRDFYAVNGPNYGPALNSGGQHNITAAGGFVVHF